MKDSLPARRTVVLATSNKGKLRELRELLAELPIDLVTPPQPIHVVEDGETFEENARKKAVTVADALAMPVIADDSGLEVDALGGRPGVRSARFAGEGATDAENNRKLLTELDALGGVPRTARFRCVLAFVDPVTRRSFVAHGTCEGSITSDGRGTGGFGYDPLFVMEGDQTMAELPDGEKNAKSHRARAIRELIPQLRRWLEV
ncbi:MAG: RdgB/HAM1 family non-canonical purine NTP pyrophosphatase [Polyangiales bacterium]